MTKYPLSSSKERLRFQTKISRANHIMYYFAPKLQHSCSVWDPRIVEQNNNIELAQFTTCCQIYMSVIAIIAITVLHT